MKISCQFRWRWGSNITFFVQQCLKIYKSGLLNSGVGLDEISTQVQSRCCWTYGRTFATCIVPCNKVHPINFTPSPKLSINPPETSSFCLALVWNKQERPVGYWYGSGHFLAWEIRIGSADNQDQAERCQWWNPHWLRATSMLQSTKIKNRVNKERLSARIVNKLTLIKHEK